MGNERSQCKAGLQRYTWNCWIYYNLGIDNSEVDKGEQEIKKVNDGERIESEVRFEKPFKNTAQVYMTTNPASANETKLKWGMAGRNPYPLNLMNVFVPSMLGKDVQKSLDNLKAVLEKN